MTTENPRPTVLVVEDDPSLRSLLGEALPRIGFSALLAADLAAARALLEAQPVDLVLTDVHLGTDSGLDLCAEVRERHPFVPTVVMTGYGKLELAIYAMRAGAWDFLVKPLDLQLARLSLERAMAHRRLGLEVRQLRRRLRHTEPFEDLLGESEPMRALFRMITRVGVASSSVLVSGESGTGKELVAKALHRSSPRSERPFVAINCAAVPEALLESELFGHLRGSFTDARSTRTGLFLEADGGTLFLDEIGDMPLGLQAKLLRVLQERRVRPVGAEREQPIDVRVVAATHQDLEDLVEQGRFRSDLLYRLDVIRLEIPPLRERGTDVLLLAQRFVQHFANQLGKAVTDLSPEVAARLLEHAWPGNVRELQNCIERAVVLAEHDTLTLADLPSKLRKAAPARTLEPADEAAAMLPLSAIEKRYILRVLESVGGSRSRASEILQIDRKTLYRKLDRWESGED